MTYQITINPALMNQGEFICRWHIEQHPTTNNTIETGKIEMKSSSQDHISDIAEKISELPNLTSKQHKDVELKFDLTTMSGEERVIDAVDLFKLYGLLSMKLKPLTINICR